MKIVIDARFYGAEHTGIGRYVMKILEEIKKYTINDEVVVLLRKKYYDTLVLPEDWKKIEVDIPHYTIREQLILPLILFKENPDIFYAPQLNVPVFYFGKMVVTIHDLTQLSIDKKATTLSLPLYLIKLLAIQVAFHKAIRVSAIVVPTNQVKNRLLQRGVKKEKINVLYEGVDKSISSQGSDSSTFKKYGLTKPYFIYVGNAYPHKNIKRAIDSIVEVNKESKTKVVFAIISARNSFTKELSDYIRTKNAEKYVLLLGYVPDNELGFLLSKSSALVYPSLHEGFGLPGLEAMNAGTLVAASDIPVFREVFSDNAIYFDPMDSGSIVRVLLKILKTKERERKMIVMQGKKHIKTFSWEKMTKELYEVLRSV